MRRRLVVLVGFVMIGAFWSANLSVHVVEAPSNDQLFSLQVTPSPIVTTLRPGQATELELKIRNASTETENLRIETRAFSIDQRSGEVRLSDNPPTEIKNWVSFATPNFSIAPGQWHTQKVKFSLPKDTGFSYSFALVISRQKEPNAVNGGRLIKGSVAVFTLINVDRPGATRKLDVAKFSISKNMYEYLPAKLDIRFKNSGNTIVAPYGNVFIQRDGSSQSPISALPVNEQRGYILPGVERTMKLAWNDGFPHYTESTSAGGLTNQSLTWNWSEVSKLRIGKYTAKLVAVYNDGGRDVPIEGEVSFWVIPWKVLLGALFVLLLVMFGLWSLVRKIVSMFKRKSKTPTASTPAD